MQKVKILNRKEIKRVLAMLEDTWGFKEELDYAFLETEKGKIYLANKEIFDLDLSKLKISSFGFYFAEIRAGIRLSIEGSQIVGKNATKNLVELDDEEAKKWMRGEDLNKPLETETFVILKHDKDFLGTGKSTKDGRILNFVPKTRRIG